MRIRRAVSLILMLVFLLEAMPLHAIAEELYPEPPTAAEIEAWVEKSGTKEGAPGYIEGMDLSASMNAVQMACWIKYFRNSWLLGVMDSYQDVDGILAEKDPSQYPLFQKYYDQCTRLEIETGGVLESLEDCISQVSDYRSQIDDKMWDEAQREEYAFLLEEAGEEMEGLMQDVMYDVPSRKDVQKCIITRATVEEGRQPVLVLNESEPRQQLTGEESA